MRPHLTEMLACPRCAGDLTLQSRVVDGDEIEEGELICTSESCAARFPITRGIPRLLPASDRVSDEAQSTVDRFGAQWNDFDFIGEHYEQQFLGWIAPNRPEVFRDKIVLEGGCGKGRHSILAARWGAKEVLAVDLGSAVEAAFKNTRRLPNVHVIQGDLFHLPIKRNIVDLAFSVGVLHHTPEPKGAFMQLVKHVRPGGKMIAWIYGQENNEWIVDYVDPIRKTVTSRLPHRWVYQLSKLPAALLYAAGKGVYQPLSKPPLNSVGDKLFYQAYINVITRFPFHEVHSIVHDHLTPPIANYIPRETFEAWFREAGLTDVEIGWHNQNSWRGTGIKKPSVAVAEDTPDPSEGVEERA